MTLYKSPRSRFWQYDFTEKGARYTGSTRCESKRDAERVEAEIKRNVRMGIKHKAHITLDAAAGTWFDRVGQHQRSAKNTRYMLKNLIGLLGGNTRMADIGFNEFAEYQAKRRAKVSDASVNREIERARALWRYTAECGFNVGEPIRWGKLLMAEPAERARELRADEEARLFERLPADLAAVVEFAMLSGQRRTAVITLRWADVDLARRVATITLKGAKQTRHTFPLSPRLVAIIANRPKVSPFVFTYECRRNQPERRKGARVWPQRVKGQRYPFSLQGWTRDWRRALADAGISDFRFHDLRHTAGSRVTRDGGGNLKVTQRLLGHTRIETTARYSHVTEEDVRDAMERVESAGKSRLTVRENPAYKVREG